MLYFYKVEVENKRRAILSMSMAASELYAARGEDKETSRLCQEILGIAAHA